MPLEKQRSIQAQAGEAIHGFAQMSTLEREEVLLMLWDDITARHIAMRRIFPLHSMPIGRCDCIQSAVEANKEKIKRQLPEIIRRVRKKERNFVWRKNSKYQTRPR